MPMSQLRIILFYFSHSFKNLEIKYIYMAYTIIKNYLIYWSVSQVVELYVKWNKKYNTIIIIIVILINLLGLISNYNIGFEWCVEFLADIREKENYFLIYLRFEYLPAILWVILPEQKFNHTQKIKWTKMFWRLNIIIIN